MENTSQNGLYTLDISNPIWERLFSVAPLIVVGTKEGEHYNLAPKHMAIPLGFDNYFGFVCTPTHSTYKNIEKTAVFTVSFPLPNQVLMASLSALPRCSDNFNSKPIIDVLPTSKASLIDAPYLRDCYLYLECELIKIIDGFGDNSLITAKIIAAHVDKNYLKLHDKDEQNQIMQHPLLAYISPGRYAKITETYNFPFPKNFKK